MKLSRRTLMQTAGAAAFVPAAAGAETMPPNPFEGKDTPKIGLAIGDGGFGGGAGRGRGGAPRARLARQPRHPRPRRPQMPQALPAARSQLAKRRRRAASASSEWNGCSREAGAFHGRRTV